MHEMMRVIPKLDDRLRQIVLVAKRAQARSAQQEISTSRRFQPQPACGQYPKKVPARKNQNVAFDRAHTINHAISPRSNLGGRFTSGTAVAEQLPVRALGVDLRSASTLVFAVVPFEQVAINIGLGAEASQFACAGCTPQRTGKYPGETPSPELFPKLVGVALAAVGQRQIGQSGVLARETPRGLTVPCEVNDGKCFTHDFVSLQRAQLRLAVTVDRQGQR